MINPDVLWLISGFGRAGGNFRPWSVVLKILKRPDREQQPDARIYWKRELLVAQSGLTERLSGPVRAPRFYQSAEYPDSGWLWMENIQDERPGPWTLENFSFAARQLGRWNGTCLEMPLPTDP